MPPEVWLRGPVPGIAPGLMPVVHGLLQAREELEHSVTDLTTAQLWARPGGAASIGFHLRHIAGATDRLLTYARGEQLSEAQRAAITGEGESGAPPDDPGQVLHLALEAIDRALDVARATSEEDLSASRAVGRAGLPSTVRGLLFHVAEHTARHVGQIATTRKIVRASG